VLAPFPSFYIQRSPPSRSARRSASGTSRRIPAVRRRRAFRDRPPHDQSLRRSDAPRGDRSRHDARRTALSWLAAPVTATMREPMPLSRLLSASYVKSSQAERLPTAGAIAASLWVPRWVQHRRRGHRGDVRYYVSRGGGHVRLAVSDLVLWTCLIVAAASLRRQQPLTPRDGAAAVAAPVP
jgi:hypothetical protein